MRLRWTTAAADDLKAIAEYLFEKSPESAPQSIRILLSHSAN
jgi:plasmid stabilization system protein ParE